ncbi:MAG TPA: hypothetical protein V6C78_04950, partial [Crinalium sp.]
MKTAESKSTSYQPHKTATPSFFNQGQEQAFFSEHAGDRPSFFPSAESNPLQFKSIAGETPFFSPSPNSLQPKSATSEVEEQSQANTESPAESPTVQRTPTFNGEAAVQLKADPKAKADSKAMAIAPPPAPSQTLLNSDKKEQEQQEEAIADVPQLQMTPAFSSADDSGNGDDGSTEPPSVQFRLAIGQPGDVYEREADAMADRVIAASKEKSSDATPKTLTTLQPPQVSRKPEA